MIITIIQTIMTLVLLYYIWQGNHIAIAIALTLQAITNAVIGYYFRRIMRYISAGL